MEQRGLKVKKLRKTITDDADSGYTEKKILVLTNKDKGIRVTIEKEDEEYAGFVTGQTIDVKLVQPQTTIKKFTKTNKSKKPKGLTISKRRVP